MGHICVKMEPTDLGQVPNSRFSEKRGKWGVLLSIIFFGLGKFVKFVVN
jgi:hypothetical protein